MQQGEVLDTTLPLSLFSVAALHFHIKQVDGKSLYSCLLLKAIPLNPLAVCHRWHARLSYMFVVATEVQQQCIKPILNRPCKKVGICCKVRFFFCSITLLDQSYALCQIFFIPFKVDINIYATLTN